METALSNVVALRQVSFHYLVAIRERRMIVVDVNRPSSMRAHCCAGAFTQRFAETLAKKKTSTQTSTQEGSFTSYEVWNLCFLNCAMALVLFWLQSRDEHWLMRWLVSLFGQNQQGVLSQEDFQIQVERQSCCECLAVHVCISFISSEALCTPGLHTLVIPYRQIIETACKVDLGWAHKDCKDAQNK